MMTKTEQVALLFREGSTSSVAKALGIMSKFRLSVTKDESRALQITHEVLTGNSSFYEQIGVDITKEMNIAKAVVRRMYDIDALF